jgi:hypothetical protein
MMRSKVVGLVAAAALSASVGIANAQRPVKLTDGQLDKVTAGANYTSANMGGNMGAYYMGAYYMGANVLSANVAANAAAMAALNNMAAVNTAAAAFANAAITP